MEQQLPQNDHDLLVTIHGQVGRAITDIKELKDNVAERVNKLEDGKLSKTDFNVSQHESNLVHVDHETRIRRLEMWGTLAIGGAYVLGVIFKYLIK